MRLGVIYKVSVGNNFIIGSTLNAKHREDQYISDLKLGKWANSYVQRSYNKYGKDVLKFEALQENIPEFILRNVENIWIGSLCARAEDGKGGMNMQDADAKRPDKIITDKRSKSLSGRKLSQEHKSKISKKVYQYSLEGEFIQEWESATKASQVLAICLSSIASARRGNPKIPGGYQWKDYYVDKIDSFERTGGNSKAIVEIDNFGIIINEWRSMQKAAKDLFIDERLLSLCCGNVINNIEGRIFKFQNLSEKRISRAEVVYQYSLSGEFIKEWKSSLEAASNFNLSESQIRNSINTKNTKAGEFLWTNLKYRFLEPYINNKGKYSCKEVWQLDLDGNKLEIFESASQAAVKLGLNNSLISEVCNKRRKSHGGYKWEFA